jgi:threonine efflux protein
VLFPCKSRGSNALAAKLGRLEKRLRTGKARRSAMGWCVREKFLPCAYTAVLCPCAGPSMNLFLTIALVHLVALLSPGPDFFFVSQTAVSRSRRQALFGVLGITLGIAFWSALALLGLQLVLQRLAWLQQAIAIAGGAYLLWMGVRMLRGAWAGGPATQTAVAARSPGGELATLRAGLLTNLANAKAVVYFGSVFSAFLGGHLDAATRWLLWLLIVAETFAWFALVAAYCRCRIRAHATSFGASAIPGLPRSCCRCCASGSPRHWAERAQLRRANSRCRPNATNTAPAKPSIQRARRR